MRGETTLYFGLEPDYEEFDFTNAHEWQHVRSQIEAVRQEQLAWGLASAAL